SRSKSPRLTLFYYFIFAGLFLDIYFARYATRFAEECAASGSSVPGTFPWLTVLSAIPAAASIIFGRSSLFKTVCLDLWIVYCGLTLHMNWEEILKEAELGINCYREIGSTAAVTFLFAAYFAIGIIAVTIAGGFIVLTRQLLLKWSS